MDERTHTDFSEKIVEHPPQIVYIDDVRDVTILRNEKDFTDTQTNISNTTNINNIINVVDNVTNVKNIENNQTNINNTDYRKVTNDTTVVREDYTNIKNVVSLDVFFIISKKSERLNVWFKSYGSF